MMHDACYTDAIAAGHASSTYEYEARIRIAEPSHRTALKGLDVLELAVCGKQEPAQSAYCTDHLLKDPVHTGSET